MSSELSTYEAMGGAYTEVAGVLYPNIIVSEEADVWVGKYGLLWIDYMKSNHAERYRHHIRKGTLNSKAFEVIADGSGNATTGAGSSTCTRGGARTRRHS